MKPLLLFAMAASATLLLTGCHDDPYYRDHHRGAVYHGRTYTRVYHRDRDYYDRGHYRHRPYYRSGRTYYSRPRPAGATISIY